MVGRGDANVSVIWLAGPAPFGRVLIGGNLVTGFSVSLRESRLGGPSSAWSVHWALNLTEAVLVLLAFFLAVGPSSVDEPATEVTRGGWHHPNSSHGKGKPPLLAGLQQRNCQIAKLLVFDHGGREGQRKDFRDTSRCARLGLVIVLGRTTLLLSSSQSGVGVKAKRHGFYMMSQIVTINGRLMRLEWTTSANPFFCFLSLLSPLR